MGVQYIGEHLGPGQLGHFFVITSFVASLFSTFSYFRAVAGEQADPAGSRTWRLMGRGGFVLHAASVVSIFIALFCIIEQHLFEYHYAWEHSSRALPAKYLLSCFWEGQEGSFMLWTFWHSVLGLIVMNTAKSLETRTMAVIAMVQVFLGTMILGFYLAPDIHVGTTPFILLRNSTMAMGAPIFSMPNYMDFIQDGNGLNVSLQNYWMVIHPPVLFLGFAATLIPFAYCIAALWKGEYTSFVKPTVAWSLFNGAVLGTGIMMGGAWAYESLNFGGYWAWDPVENASLVPWLTLIGGLHTLLVYRSTGRALTVTLVLLLLTHLLVWYSTFLTRTGILGKTSVHAFTGDGKSLTYHLLVVIGLLLIITVVMLIRRWRKLPRIKTEEETLSREFWMFIGAIVLFLSSVQIIITTSIPVWSPLAKLMTGKDFAPPTDVVQHYNNIQVWIAIVTGILMAVVLYMRFKHTDGKSIGVRLGVLALAAAAMATGIGVTQKITTWQYDLMLFAACYGILAAIYYGVVVQRVKLKKLGPSVAHLGFAMVLLGILLSSYNKHAISFNLSGENFNPNKKTAAERAQENSENELLFRSVPTPMSDYTATYVSDSEHLQGKDRIVYYRIDFEKRDKTTNKVTEQFSLYPDAFINTKGQGVLTVNPSTKHFWDHDVFTFINGGTLDKTKGDTSAYSSHVVHKAGDTIMLKNGFMVFIGLIKNVTDKRYVPEEGDISLAARFQVYNNKSEPVKEIAPVYIIKKMQFKTFIADTLPQMDLFTYVNDIHIDTRDSVTANSPVSIDIKVKDDFIILKALVFPFINVLWLGIIIMVFGFFISLGDAISRRALSPGDTGK